MPESFHDRDCLPLTNAEPSNTTRRAIYLLTGLIVANLLAWAWAFIEFGNNPVLMGTALLAYGFGLRHAVDADHIAAIDNVTRKLMQQGKRPIAVGTWFSLGHSTIVVLASFAIAATAMAFKDDMEWFHETGGLIGTLVSSVFLLLFGVLNLVILISVYKKFKQVKAGHTLPRRTGPDHHPPGWPDGANFWSGVQPG